jgi:lysophospholipid acyltransferase (LPLAT)-like uncharacterized protein
LHEAGQYAIALAPSEPRTNLQRHRGLNHKQADAKHLHLLLLETDLVFLGMCHDHRLTLGQRLKFWLIADLGARLLKPIFSTCRVKVLTPEADRRLLSGQWSVIGATWHRAAIFFLYYYGRLGPAIMISRSKDGELLARYLKVMGGVPVRGSSSKGGGEALRKMESMIMSGQVTQAATVADGPRGPRYVAKPGMILLAMRTGKPLLPLMWSCNRAWIFGRSWDHTMIPKPFSTVAMVYGRELHYPPELDNDGLESARLELEEELNRLRRHVDDLCGHHDPK